MHIVCSFFNKLHADCNDFDLFLLFANPLALMPSVDFISNNLALFGENAIQAEPRTNPSKNLLDTHIKLK